MIVVQNRIKVGEAFRKEFLERFKNRDSNLKTHEGFISNYILEPVGDDNEYIVMTIWESKQFFEKWANSDDFKKAHSEPMPQGAILDRPVLKIYNVASSVV